MGDFKMFYVSSFVLLMRPLVLALIQPGVVTYPIKVRLTAALITLYFCFYLKKIVTNEGGNTSHLKHGPLNESPFIQVQNSFF